MHEIDPGELQNHGTRRKKQLDQGDKSKNCLTIYHVVTNNSKKFVTYMHECI